MTLPKKIFSFDVFDTCVSRTYAYPRDLFYDLGMRLAPNHLSEAEVASFAERFQRLRIKAEKKSYRVAKPHECTNIFEIYGQFQLPSCLKVSHSDIIAKEVALERESIYAIPETVGEIDRLRRSGNKILFVSDMYLPAAILAPMLQELGVMRKDDKLYVSCDVRLTKRSGNLFRHILQAENVGSGDVFHVGDNQWSDIRMARQLGISAGHFNKALLSRHESGIAGRKVSSSSSASSLAALSRQSRLAMQTDDQSMSHALDSVIHSTISPFLIAFVIWVLDEARKTGVKRLYFVARDGQVLYRIASQLMSEDNSIELRYLHGSRRAWLAPSVTSESTAWMRLLATPGQSNTHSDILSRMGIHADEQLQIKDALHINQSAWRASLNLQQATSFMQDMVRSSGAAEIVFNSASRAREIAVRFFTQEGLLDNVSWALVDAGWALNCQAALKRILSSASGRDFQPIGYYIALTRDHLGMNDAGIGRSFVSELGSIFSRRRVIVEHCFTPSTHPSTRSYALQDNVVVPVFGPELRNHSELEYAKRLHEISVHCAGLIRSNNRLREQLLSSTEAIVRNVENFISHPSPQDAKLMSGFGTIADLRHEKSLVQPLCRPLELNDLWSVIGVTVSKKKNFGIPSFMWLEGSGALSGIYVRIPLAIMLWLDSVLNRFKKAWQATS